MVIWLALQTKVEVKGLSMGRLDMKKVVVIVVMAVDDSGWQWMEDVIKWPMRV